MLVLLLTVCLTIVTAADYAPQQVTGTFGSEVILPCQGRAKHGRVYWQKREPHSTREKVVNALCLPREPCVDLIDPAYAGRSDFLANRTGGDFSLQLRSLTVADDGIYKCILMESGDVSQRMVNLSIKAVSARLNPLRRADLFLGVPGGQPGFSQLSSAILVISVLAWIDLWTRW